MSTLTIAEAARLVGVSARALQKRAAKGSIETVRVSRGGRIVAAVTLEELHRHYPSAAGGSEPGSEPPSSETPEANGVPNPREPVAVALETVQESTSRALAVLTDRHRGEVSELRTELVRARDRQASERNRLGALLLVTVGLGGAAGALAWSARGEVHAARNEARELRSELGSERSERGSLAGRLEATEERLGEAESRAEELARNLETIQARERARRAGRASMLVLRYALTGRH